MQITYLWLTMGPYHVARMNAISEIIGSKNLTVIEICSKDDHDWDLQHYEKKFNYHCIFKDEILNEKSLDKSIILLKEWFLKNDSQIVVNACGYFNWSLRQLLAEHKRRFEKLILWSETTAIDNPNPWYKKLLKKFMTSIYDGAIVAGNRHKEFMKTLGFRDSQIKIVGNVVDNSIFKPVFDVYERKKTILFVGRLLKIKNVKTLLQAFESISHEFKEWKLHIVGKGPEENEIKKWIIDHHLQNSVELLGSKQPQDLISLYQSSGLFVLPSYSEPWGLVVNEAMASGMPCVISKQCGSAEIVENLKSAYLFDAMNVMELKEILRTLIQKPEIRGELSKNGYQVISAFTPQAYAKNVIDFFIKITK